MFRTFAPAALAAVTLALVPAAGAQTGRGYYSATPVAAPAKTTLVTRSTVWKCSNGLCGAAKASTRDTVMCELVVRELGQVSAFRAGGKAFDEAALAKCNKRAR